MATTFSANWKSKANILLSSPTLIGRTQAFIYTLKQVLVGAIAPFNDPSWGGKWTVLGSSDGTTAGMDGVDRWTDPTKIIDCVNAANNPRSWICLAHSSGNRLTLGLNNPGTADNTGFIFNLHRPPDPEGPGVVTATPGGNGIGNTQPTMGSSAVIDYRMHVSVSDDGALAIVVNEVGKGTFYAGWFIINLEDTRASEGFPVVSLTPSVSTSGGFASTHVVVTNGLKARRSDRTAGCTAYAGTLSANGPGYPMAYFTGSDAYDPVGSRPSWPIWLITDEPSIRGRMRDFAFGPENMVNGMVEPSLASPKSMAVGTLWVPMSEVPDMS